MTEPGITVCIPTIGPRYENGMTERAVRSAQLALHHAELPVSNFLVSIDLHREGAARNRDYALVEAKTEWVAFLDDDDEMDPIHLKALWTAAQEYKADYLWSQFRIGLPDGTYRAGPKPLGPGSFDQWNDDQPAQTTVTTLVRRELALDVGGFSGQMLDDDGTIDGQRAGEDWLFTLACRATGATFRHVPEVTWTWHHHASNTSGRPDRW